MLSKLNVTGAEFKDMIYTSIPAAILSTLLAPRLFATDSFASMNPFLSIFLGWAVLGSAMFVVSFLLYKGKAILEKKVLQSLLARGGILAIVVTLIGLAKTAPVTAQIFAVSQINTQLGQASIADLSIAGLFMTWLIFVSVGVIAEFFKVDEWSGAEGTI